MTRPDSIAYPPRALRADHSETLYITDAELIRRIGVPEKIARRVIRELDAKSHLTGFPQKQKLWGGRRYWPAVKAYLDRTSGLNTGLSERQKERV